MSKPLPTKSTRLRNLGNRENQILCPVCGANKPVRALLTCYRCWSEVPQDLKLKAMASARSNRTSVALGPVAAEVIASIAVPKGQDEAEAA